MKVIEFANEYEKAIEVFLEKHPEKEDWEEVKEGREIISRIKNDPTRHFKELSKAQERKVKKGFKLLTK